MGAPLEQVDTPWIVRRAGAGTYNGKGGYTDTTTDVASYYGRSRESRPSVDPTISEDQGEFARTRRVVIFDRGKIVPPLLDIKESDKLIEGIDSGGGVIVENPNGEQFDILNVRIYDRTTQVDVSIIDN